MTLILDANQSCVVTSTPKTIAEAYAAWVAIEAQRNSTTDLDDEAADRLAAAQYTLENAAAEMPATTPTEVWMLWAMASPDIYGDGAFNIALCVRARKEARAAADLVVVPA
ncbi:MAG: hypothetical protein JNK34_01370 [Tabrizicola sp.]|nr:hypothetical protein [Tabrizicola sp.]